MKPNGISEDWKRKEKLSRILYDLQIFNSYLKAEAFSVIETVSNLLSDSGLLWIGFGPNPNIHNAPFVFSIEWHLFILQVKRVYMDKGQSTLRK